MLRLIRSLPHEQHGISLVELMISLTLGLIIVSALAGMIANQSTLRAELDRSSKMIANGKYAIEVLSDDFRMAGFYGTLAPTTLALPAALPDPCSVSATELAAALRLHVQGYDAATPSSAASGVPSCVSSVATALKAGSDVVVMRRADNATEIDPGVAVNGTHYLQPSLCSYDAESYVLATDPSLLTLRQMGCTATSTTPYATARPFRVEIYFVDSNNEAADGIPTLKKIELQNGAFSGAIPLVEGIEFLQVEYGLDDNNDGVADRFIQCSACSVSDWASVVSVKLNLVSRSQEQSARYVNDKTLSLGEAGTVGPFNDAFRRNAYYQSVRLVNPAARKESP